MSKMFANNITMVIIYTNYGHTLSKRTTVRTTVRTNNNVLYSVKLRYACCKKCIYITMVTIYPNYGHTIAIVFFFLTNKY